MWTPLQTWLNYVYKDYRSILNSELEEHKLKKLNRSGWIHQIILAPMFAPLMLVGNLELGSGHYTYGIMHEAMGFTLYSIYLRYGFRHYGVRKKRKEIAQSLESVIRSTNIQN